MQRIALLLAALSATFFARVSSAHIRIDAPPARVAGMKTAPCGATSQRSANPPEFAPGESIRVAWTETVQHAGYFRISFSENGTTFPADPPYTVVNNAASGTMPTTTVFPVLALIPKTGDVATHSAMVTLPNTPCASCSLQLIQFMNGHALPQVFYYQCADIVIRAGQGGSGGTSNAGSGGSSAGNAGTNSGGSSSGAAGGGTNSGAASGGPSGGAPSAGAPSSGGAPSAGAPSAGAPSAGAISSGGTSSAGAGNDAGAADGNSMDDGGCSCSVLPVSGAPVGLLSAAVGAALALGRRRRSRR